MKKLTIILLCISTVGIAQRKVTSEGEERTRISLKEKQNQPLKILPEILLEAWCNGEINAFYPKNLHTQMDYASFLYHFGMEDRAYQVLENDAPSWFCGKETKCVTPDIYTMGCFQYEIELGEENYFDQTSSLQKKEIQYVKLIFASICDARGIELEGPVFKMKDLKKLDQKYRIQNPQNDAAKLPIWSYLTIGNYKRTTVYKKGDFVSNPARVSWSELEKRVNDENGKWEN